jgi:hypothetical protein
MDELLKEAILITIKNGSGSPALLQRELRLGYNKAGRLMDEMERLGVISKINGSKPRELLIEKIEDIQWKQLYTEHIVIDMDDSMVQRCILCGETIADYREVSWHKGMGQPKGWAAGSVFVSPRYQQPIIYKNEINDNETSTRCKVSM